MDLEDKSNELKGLIATYDTAWFLGDLTASLRSIGKSFGQDEIGLLSSPLKQLYFLAGLLITSDPTLGKRKSFDREKWDKIVKLLNEIEREYHKLFLPKSDDEFDERWIRIRKIAIPSFLTYFNQGPLNYEEQIINWINKLYSKFDDFIVNEIGITTSEILKFYENLDLLVQNNFKGIMSPIDELRKDWKKYAKTELVFSAPFPLKFETDEKESAVAHFISDQGLINRFFLDELKSQELSIEKVTTINKLLSYKRDSRDYIYYADSQKGNPIYKTPIVDIGDGMFQVFDVKQVLHSIEDLLESICIKNSIALPRLIKWKGKVLENEIEDIFSNYFKNEIKIFKDYYIDGNEQDILILWNKYAFIIEAKGYSLREPLRNPDLAYVKITDDFSASIGYGYKQTRRVEKYFIGKLPMTITNKNGKILETIETSRFNEDFSIIVTLKSFGPIQIDLSTMIELENEDDVYPWALKLHDLEVFILTLIAQKKTPDKLVDFLLLREQLHGKLQCGDELEICGGYLTGKINQKIIENNELVTTNPSFASIFDSQYKKGMGFNNEKYMPDKTSGKYISI